MGSPAGEERRSDEEKQHQVTLTRPYFLKVTEVTQGEYESLMGSNPSLLKACGASCPVEKVGWLDAVAYVNALSRKEGLPECYRVTGAAVSFEGLDCGGYRLPTEAEWEYAARAGTTGARYGELDAVAWHQGNSGTKTHPVAQKASNAWGLHDMLGNVSEWCHDCHGDYPYGAVTDPTGPATATYRVIRGGNWVDDARFVRAAGRYRWALDNRDASLGFRPARSIP